MRALAFAGFAIATYLTLYQLGAYDDVWDPFFDARAVLDATHPIPDAAAGAIAYGAELLLIGRREPLARIGLGVLLATGVVVSIGLIVAQAAIIGDWCTLCLTSAGLSFALFLLGFDEVRTAFRLVSERIRAHVRVPI